MIRRVVVQALLLVAFTATGSPAHNRTAPRQTRPGRVLLDRALAAMGGEGAVRAIATVHFEATEQRRALEQSERPEGPYLVESTHVSEWRDLTTARWKRLADTQFAWLRATTTTTVAGGVSARAIGGRTAPGDGQDLADAEEALEMGPERVLVTAMDARDLRRRPDVTLQAVAQNVLTFTWRGRPARIFLNADTHLPTAVEWTRAYPFHQFWSVWGDVTTRVYYSIWWLGPGDVRYPLQYDVVRNGLPDRTITITKLEISAPLPGDTFAIDASTGSAYKTAAVRTIDQRPLPSAAALSLAPDIVFIRGSWNTTIVRQADGIVILEAPISSGYSAQVIAEASRRYPGVPIKAVISTADSWPHIGGVREYVANGVPVYVLDRTRPLLERLVEARHRIVPDALARSPRPARFIEVSRKTIVGSGPNRMEIYPMRGETTERQMLVYFPAHKLLYGSDAFQRMPDGTYFYPQTIAELREAVARAHLEVETFFMMHIGPMSWREILDVHGGTIPSS